MLAATDTKHSEVKLRDVLRTKCNGPAVVRQDFPAIQDFGEYISVCDVCMCYTFFNEL